jgi:hypothetical protein
MSSFDNPVVNRIVGEKYPLSIALELAILGILGIHPDLPTGKNLLPNYQVVWVNIRTMYRNLFNAINKEDKASVLPGQLVTGLLQELEQFENILDIESKGKLSVVYYHSRYANMHKQYPHAFLRADSTELQKTYSVIEKICLDAVMDQLRDKVKCYDLKITDFVSSKTLLMSHYPIDLFTKSIVDKDLWESHTGRVKQKHHWYTKYFNGKDLSMIPFREEFIQLFGDNEQFRPMSISIRKEITQLAVDNGWSQMTQREKIMYCLDKLKDPDTKDLMFKLMH